MLYKDLVSGVEAILVHRPEKSFVHIIIKVKQKSKMQQITIHFIFKSCFCVFARFSLFAGNVFATNFTLLDT